MDMIEEVVTTMMIYSKEDRETTIRRIQRFAVETERTLSDTIKYIHKVFKVKIILNGTAEKVERIEPEKKKTLDDIF